MRFTLLLGSLFGLAFSLAAEPSYSPAPPPPASLPSAVAIRSFDPAGLRLKWDHRRWLLVDSEGKPLKDLGLVENDARQALRLIRELGLTEYGIIGSPRPVVEFWLANGRAPVRLPRQGVRMIALEPEQMQIEGLHGQWVVKDRMRVLFAFPTEAEAKQTLDLFKQHRFQQVGILGVGTPVMTVFFGSPEAKRDTTALTAAGRPMEMGKFPRTAPPAEGAPRLETGKAPGTRGAGTEAAALPGLNPQTPVLPNTAASSKAAAPRLGRSSPSWRTETGIQPARPGDGLIEADIDGRVAHDYRNMQLRQDRGEWSIVVGSQVVARFGQHASNARLALNALRYYRSTEHYRLGGSFVGRWVPVAPSSPSGVMFGLAAIHIQPEKLAVQQVGEVYALAEEGQVKVVIGDRAEDAREVLDLIQRYQADRICRIGHGPEGMAFLARSKPFAAAPNTGQEGPVPGLPGINR
jgi:hypothetical protein